MRTLRTVNAEIRGIGLPPPIRLDAPRRVDQNDGMITFLYVNVCFCAGRSDVQRNLI